MATSQISIIIPVLNEASKIAETLANAYNASNVEVIVVDGGSQDQTIEIALSFGAQVLSSPAGRANQMNTGALAASGEILLFLHGDTRLPTNFDTLIRQAIASPDTIAGAFELRIDSHMGGLRLIEKIVNARSHWFSMPYGDQAIFLQKSVFQEIGGFPNLPIMEDFELMRRLRGLGKIAIVSATVLTSGRRWQKLGVVKTTLINQLIIIGYFLGVPPKILVRCYRRR
ncbi:MAG: glycosyltransferase family 2 protein [Symploca sp. SIO1C4]|uniref:4,4'-diaponeurosporenoate glycosyltransferase n=1 Tax=Symploca sp. SIO1C4 TaxID=2607765 RepID=A0A6B3NA97_9CYAN|nr:glycosyltransferase family 2 protein [Symploca sp. SIO1C4]NET06109.1 glycosyltransferase family 2 protein [Symploca sp. SIO2B6]